MLDVRVTQVSLRRGGLYDTIYDARTLGAVVDRIGWMDRE